jgi:hypothetical protein
MKSEMIKVDSEEIEIPSKINMTVKPGDRMRKLSSSSEDSD